MIRHDIIRWFANHSVLHEMRATESCHPAGAALWQDPAGSNSLGDRESCSSRRGRVGTRSFGLISCEWSEISEIVLVCFIVWLVIRYIVNISYPQYYIIYHILLYYVYLHSISFAHLLPSCPSLPSVMSHGALSIYSLYHSSNSDSIVCSIMPIFLSLFQCHFFRIKFSIYIFDYHTYSIIDIFFLNVCSGGKHK